MVKRNTILVPMDERHLVSLKTIARLVDAHRSSVRRWLNEVGIRPVALGRGRNGAIRYRWSEVEKWISEAVEVN